MSTTEFRVPESEIDFSFVRSSGPGGQNVNKVNSKAVLRWNLLESPSVPEHKRNRLLLKLASRLTTEGEIVLTSDRFRDQGMNRQDCVDKLHSLLAQALIVPKPRKKTQPSKGSQRRAKAAKQQHSAKKAMRGKGGYDD